MVLRKAERVLPDPVGAAMRVSRPSRMAGQPFACGGVTVSKRAANQRFTAGWNASSAGLVLRRVRAITNAPGGARLFYASHRVTRNAGMAEWGYGVNCNEYSERFLLERCLKHSLQH